jgi:hypothetical protein
MPATDFLAVIHALSEHCVDFIVVGGVAAVLEGAPISTFDLDIVHSRAIDNVQRLEHVTELQVEPGHIIRVLKLSKLIEVKSETAAEKDFATLPILRKTLEEKGRR